LGPGSQNSALYSTTKRVGVDRKWWKTRHRVEYAATYLGRGQAAALKMRLHNRLQRKAVQVLGFKRLVRFSAAVRGARTRNQRKNMRNIKLISSLLIKLFPFNKRNSCAEILSMSRWFQNPTIRMQMIPMQFPVPPVIEQSTSNTVRIRLTINN